MQLYVRLHPGHAGQKPPAPFLLAVEEGSNTEDTSTLLDLVFILADLGDDHAGHPAGRMHDRMSIV